MAPAIAWRHREYSPVFAYRAGPRCCIPGTCYRCFYIEEGSFFPVPRPDIEFLSLIFFSMLLFFNRLASDVHMRSDRYYVQHIRGLIVFLGWQAV